MPDNCGTNQRKGRLCFWSKSPTMSETLLLDPIVVVVVVAVVDDGLISI